MKLAMIFVAIAFLLSLAVLRCEAEASGVMELQANVGGAGFLDEESPMDHFAVGTFFRWYCTPRLAVGPEVTYLWGPGSDRDLTLLGSVSYDIMKSEGFAISMIGAGGVIRHTEEFPYALEQYQKFSSSGWTANGGARLKVFATPKVFFTGEARFGWEPLYQFIGGIGFAF